MNKFVWSAGKSFLRPFFLIRNKLRSFCTKFSSSFYVISLALFLWAHCFFEKHTLSDVSQVVVLFLCTYCSSVPAVPLFLCSSESLFPSSSVPLYLLFLCSSVPLFLCSTVSLFLCSSFPLFCSSVSLYLLFLCSSVPAIPLFLCVYSSSVPQFLPFLCSSVSLCQLFPALYLLFHCSSVPLCTCAYCFCEVYT